MAKRFCRWGHDTALLGRYPSTGACVVCVRTRVVKWAKDNPEKRRVIWSRYNRRRPRNPCRRCGQIRPFIRGNIYCLTCRPLARADNDAAYRKRNRRVFNERSLAYTRKLKKLPVEELNLIWGYYGPSCVYCGRPATGLDHLQPLSRDGQHAAENLAPCCKSCNSRKGARPIWTMVA